MVHVSLRSVGPINGRAEALVRALLKVLGPNGILSAYADYQPTDEIPYFDPDRSPAVPEYGVFPEILRNWPGAVRSRNPGASIVAVGDRAGWLCEGHSLNYGYGEDSPYKKLVEIEGKVLLLGSEFEHVTLLHHAEHIARLPDKRVIQVPTKILFQGRITEVTIEEYDTSRMVLDKMPAHYFGEIVQAFIEGQGTFSGLVGNAKSYILPAKAFIEFAVDRMEREFGT